MTLKQWAKKEWDEKTDYGPAWGEEEVFDYVINKLDPIFTEAYAVLKELEWEGYDVLFKDVCPSCGDAGEHEPDCRLVALLKELESVLNG